MDPKRPANKTYSEVMNEWAAQRHLVHANRSRLIHPPYDAHPVAKAVGYLGRLLVLLTIPAAGYLIALRQFGVSDAFNDEISAGLAATLEAKSTDTKSAQWKMNGMLTIRALEAEGNDGTFYERLEAVNLGTRVPIPMIFHREWMIPRVSIEDLTIALRSGGKGKDPVSPTSNPVDDIRLPTLPGLVPTAPQDDTPAPRPAILPSINTGHALPSPPPQAPAVLHAGFGISPDFSSIRYLALQMARLNASWGTSAVTSGKVTGMQTDFTRNSTGWVISGNGGEFSQGWLEGMLVKKMAVTLTETEASIDEVLFTRHGGGQAGMKGRLTFGEQPELAATLSLEGVRLQDFVAPDSATVFDAEGSGTVQLSGSVNRASGIRMDGSLTIGPGGRVIGLPVLKALSQITGEGQYRQLPVRSGLVDFTTSGSSEHGGLVVEIKKLEVDLGPLARLRGHYRQEQFRQEIPGKESAAEEMVKVSGLLQLGIPESVGSKMKEPVRTRFFTSDNAGWLWIDLPVARRLTAQFSKEAGLALIEANNAP